MRLVRAVVAALLIVGASAAAKAADLEAVHAALLPLRKHAEAPGTTLRPEFLTAREHLRDWIETRLGDLKPEGDTDTFAKALNGETAAADLRCVEAKPPGYNRCTSPGDLDARGYVGIIDAARVQGLLIVQAELGVTCGFDETAYIYEWVKDRWVRKLDTTLMPEKGVYVAERIQQVLFGRAKNRPADEVLFVVTGVHPTCAGGFRPVHYRVWAMRGRASPATPGLMVDGREMLAYHDRRSPAVSARFDGNDVLVEMDVASIDPGVHHRTAVRRFAFDTLGAHRVAPIALTPRDFVEEWLRAPWSTASAWTKRDARPALQTLHADANTADLRVRFTGPTQRCRDEDNVVQVGVRFASGERFFRLKQDAAGASEMHGADSAPNPACATPDASLDTPRSLF